MSKTSKQWTCKQCFWSGTEEQLEGGHLCPHCYIEFDPEDTDNWEPTEDMHFEDEEEWPDEDDLPSYYLYPVEDV